MRRAVASRRKSKGFKSWQRLRENNAPRSELMDNVARLDPDTAWAAFMRRDRSWDGRVIGAVKTTGIYCKPSCPARRPKRENVELLRERRGKRERRAIGRACAASRTRSAATAKRWRRR